MTFGTVPTAYQSREAMEFRARYKAFVSWLIENGVTLVAPCSDYEVLRYLAWDDSQSAKAKRPMTHVVYRKANGAITFSGASYRHFNLFVARRPFPDQSRGADIVVKERPKTKSWAKRTRELLHERDGDLCYFCHRPLTEHSEPKRKGPETIEHMLAKHLGGTDHMDNLVLAHARCNRDAGHKTVEEKRAIRELYRGGLHSKVEHWSDK